MTTRTWDTTTPADTGFAGDGDDRIRDTKVDLKERLEQDHYMEGELDPLEGDCDGYHRKATLYAQATDPTPLTGTGVIYTKVVDGVTELFFRDATTGTINQLTENGVLSLNTLANDIDANGHGIIGADILESDVVTAGTLNVTTIAKTGTGLITNLNADLWDGRHAPSGTVVGTSDSQSISNKTLTSSCTIDLNCLILVTLNDSGNLSHNDIYDAFYSYLSDGVLYGAMGSIWSYTVMAVRKDVGDPSTISFYVADVNGKRTTLTYENNNSAGANTASQYGYYIRVFNNL